MNYMIDDFKEDNLVEHLKSFYFFDFFNKNVLPGTDPSFNGGNINFGTRRKGFTDREEIKNILWSGTDNIGVFEANRAYLNFYPIIPDRIEKWQKVLKESNSEEELFVEILDIFDWGNVYAKNVSDLILLKRGKYDFNGKKIGLLEYIDSIRDNIINCKFIDHDKVIMSSGWTKVYSYANDALLIYDSRVSAFLNYCLFMCYDDAIKHDNLTEEAKKSFRLIIQHLCNFGGTNSERVRHLKFEKGCSEFNKKTEGTDGFNASILASKIAKCIWDNIPLEIKKEGFNGSQNEINGIRVLERAFFILGFDLKVFQVPDPSSQVPNSKSAFTADYFSKYTFEK